MLKKIFQFKRIFLLLLAPLAAVLILLAEWNNEWVEKFFVPYIYKPLHYVIGTVVSFFPFSVTEVAVILLVIFAVWYIVQLIIRIVKEKRAWKHHLYKAFINLLCVASVAFFGFELCMGLNYYRYEAAHYLELDVRESTTEELYDLCLILAKDMNESRAKLKENKDGIAVLSDKNRYETGEAAMKAFKKLAEDYPILEGADIRNKPLWSSGLFSYALTTGIYIPYTFESNINVAVPEHTIPSTMCHELTHSRGFMREDEANFLGYLACMYSERADFNYSGSVMAFNYCLNKLYDDDISLAKKVVKKCDAGVIDDMLYESEYWDQYFGNPVAEVTENVYNGYLEFNGEESGTKSYGKMVDLLLAYYR